MIKYHPVKYHPTKPAPFWAIGVDTTFYWSGYKCTKRSSRTAFVGEA